MTEFDSPTMLKAIDQMDKRNYLQALALLMPLAEAGNPRALRSLANLHHFGWGVEADGKKATEPYVKVAEQNIQDQHLSALAYQSLATLYITRAPGVDPDRKKAAQYEKLAKDLGFDV
jgi:TPR repeat protein